MMFIRIGGRATCRPPLVARLQTDATFNHRHPLDSTGACILQTATYKATYRERFPLGRMVNSTEAEWAAVDAALTFALEKDELAVELENDNLSVISQLMRDSYPKQIYARYYHKKIRAQADHMEWLSVRWIPRETNVADLLLR